MEGLGQVRYTVGRRTRTYERQKGTVPGGTKRARVRMGEEEDQEEGIEKEKERGEQDRKDGKEE